MRAHVHVLLVLVFATTVHAAIIDDFADSRKWTAAPSDGVSLALVPDHGAMRMDFDFRGHGGWAAARRTVNIDLPDNYRFVFRLRGETPPNTLELKFIDPSGENVWWVRRVAWEFPRDWTDVIADKRTIEFAWGPSANHVLTKIGTIEVTVTAATGGKGSVWLERITFDDLPLDASTPAITATSSLSGQTPDRVMDNRADTAWRSASGGAQSLTIDFRAAREFGGLIVQWSGSDFASDYDVAVSNDGNEWSNVRAVQGGNGGRDYLQTPNAAARFVRFNFARGAPAYAINEITVEPPRFGDRAVNVYQSMAHDAPRGHYPRGLIGELAYWTIFGVDRDEGAKPLLSEDGAIETPAGFTLEPFVRIDGRLMTWAGVTTSQSLEQNSLPLPSTTWRHPKFTLEIAPFGAGTAAAPIGYARYRLRNTSTRTERAQFFVAIRPLRVTPPWHELNIAELTAPIRAITWNGTEFAIDDTRVVPLTKPSAIAASTFDGGDAILGESGVGGRESEITPSSFSARLPPTPGTRQPTTDNLSITDPQRHASALMMWDLTLAPGEERVIDLAMPLHPRDAQTIPHDVAHQRATAIAYWRAIVDHVQIDIPAARDLVDTARANVAYNLLGRDGPAIRGGARNYRRSWIRDGSLASTMLLRFGLADDVRDYIRWFAPYQFANGKIPCCIDARGADPVAEHDSHGEFIYLVAEYTRLTGDLSLAREIWPHVEKAAAYIDVLRGWGVGSGGSGVGAHSEPSSSENRQPTTDNLFKGLLPPSISHEGYSAKPMHSYWDDFFALRGLKDATWLAKQLGQTEAATRFAASRDEFARDFHASIRHAIETHHIDYIPGCADLGDFDPTSTTIGIEPGGDLANLPHDAVINEFTRAWNESLARMEGRRAWKVYTPYELRQVGSFVHLGWHDRAQQLLKFFLDDRRPLGWRQWPEVVAQDYRAPTYLGDIPHLWVGSDFVRSFLDMIAYEREEDDALVLGAGIPDSWLDEGVRVRGLRTIYGPLDFSAQREGGRVAVSISGVGVPKGGIVVMLPGVEQIIRQVPAHVVLTK
jgi:Glycogen debranching enzyme